MEEHHKAYVDHEVVKCLNVPNAIAEARRAFENLGTGLEDIKRWQFGVDLKKKKEDFNSYIEQFDKKFGLLLDFEAAPHEV